MQEQEIVGRTFSAFSELWLGEAPMAEGLSLLVSLNNQTFQYQYFVQLYIFKSFLIITKFCLQLLLVIHDDNSFIFIVNPGLFSRVGVAESFAKCQCKSPNLSFDKTSLLPSGARDPLVRFIWANVDQLVPHWLPECYACWI